MANLLPHNAQKTVFLAVVARVLVTLCVVCVIATTIGVTAVAPAYIVWDSERGAREYELASLQAVNGYDYKTLQEEVVAVNRQTKIVQTLSARAGGVTKAIRAVSVAQPTGVSISRFVYSAPLEGTDVSRLAVTATISDADAQDIFLNSLHANSLFDSVDVPIAALVRESGDDVTIDMTGLF